LDEAVTTDALPGAPKLAKSLRARHVAMISIGGIVGAGLFVNSANAIAAIGPAVIVSYVLTGLIVLLVMRMLAEMATARHGIGSCTEYARLAMGNLAGFSFGWIYWYFWVVVVAFEALVGAEIASHYLPGETPVWIIALVLTVLLTATNLLSTRSYGEFEFWFSLDQGRPPSSSSSSSPAPTPSAGTKPVPPTFDSLVNDGGFAPARLDRRARRRRLACLHTRWSRDHQPSPPPNPDAGEKIIARLATNLINPGCCCSISSRSPLIMCVVPWREIAEQKAIGPMSPFTMALQKGRHRRRARDHGCNRPWSPCCPASIQASMSARA
jgi:hypothetical protein